MHYDYNLYLKTAIRNCYKYSFFVRIVNKWNELPKNVVHASSITLVFFYKNLFYNNIEAEIYEMLRIF